MIDLIFIIKKNIYICIKSILHVYQRADKETRWIYVKAHEEAWKASNAMPCEQLGPGLPLGHGGHRATLSRDKIRDCTCSHKSRATILSLIHIPAPDWPLILLRISFNTPAGKRRAPPDSTPPCSSPAPVSSSFFSGARALHLDFIGEPLISPWILLIPVSFEPGCIIQVGRTPLRTTSTSWDTCLCDRAQKDPLYLLRIATWLHLEQLL